MNNQTSITLKAMNYKVAVPVKPHVKQFILRYHPVEPIRVGLDSTIPKLLCGFLNRMKREPDNRYPALTEVLQFEVPETEAMVYGYEINRCQAYQFNDLVDGIMREILFGRIDMIGKFSSLKRVQIKQVIDDFQREYGLDDDLHISYDTLKKDYYRWQKQMTGGSKLFNPNKSLKK
jgi:hypothetical protein